MINADKQKKNRTDTSTESCLQIKTGLVARAIRNKLNILLGALKDCPD